MDATLPRAPARLVKSWRDIPVDSWFTFAQLYLDMVERAPKGAVFVEVGCFLGRSSAFLATAIKESGKRIDLWCVDTWDNRSGQSSDQRAQDKALAEAGLVGADLEWAWTRNMRSCGVEEIAMPLPMESVTAADTFEDGSIDFCFIDAAHDHESVKADLAAWWPKIKSGGTFAGHDYYNGHVAVDAAVEEFFRGRAIISELGFCWMVVKDAG